MLRHFYRRFTITLAGTIELWWFPALAGTATAVIVWVVWYLTEVPCTPANAAAYQCNPSPIARYINSDILGRCITLGAIVATLAGGLNIYMFAKEREARIAAEKGREADRQRFEEQRQHFEEQRQEDRRRFEEQLQEERRRSEAHREEERRRSEADRQRSEAQREEERRRSEETHQAMLAAIAGLTDKITELAGPNRDNGR